MYETVVEVGLFDASLLEDVMTKSLLMYSAACVFFLRLNVQNKPPAIRMMATDPKAYSIPRDENKNQ